MYTYSRSPLGMAFPPRLTWLTRLAQPSRRLVPAIILIVLLSGVGAWGQSSIMISQYIETSSGSTPKGIEIMNVSQSPITFSAGNNLQVFQGNNGASCTTATVNITSGTLEPGEVWVMGTTDLVNYANTNGTDLSGTTTFPYTFNGDDALVVQLGGVTQDVIGLCGFDPGDAWTGNGVSTANQNIQIKSGICYGDTEGWTDPSIRFEFVAVGTDMTGFGSAPHTCLVEGCPAPGMPQATDIAYTSATLTWTGSADSYEIKWTADPEDDGFDPDTEGTLEETEENDILLEGLSNATRYSFYVRGICNDEPGAWSEKATFVTGEPATHLVLVSVPTSGYVNVDLPAFQVEARSAGDIVDVLYTGDITIARESGPGYLTGTLTKAAVSGVATFNDISFDAPGSYTFSASATGLTGAESEAIEIEEIVLPLMAWDFTGENNVTTSAAEIYDDNLDGSNLLTRGAGAPASAAANSFRTVGFQNNGISTANTDYFEVNLSAADGYTLSLSGIDCIVAGTGTYAADPGVNQQFAYSLDGTNFTLIGDPVNNIGTPAVLPTISLSEVEALQDLPSGTTVTLRYYATGQTSTGGWGFNSPSSGQYGLAIYGDVEFVGSSSPELVVNPASLSGFTYTCGLGPSVSQSFMLSGSNLTDNVTVSVAGAHYEISSDNENWSNGIMLAPTGGDIAATIYVRLIAGLEPGMYNGQSIQVSSDGAADKFVSLSGSVTNLAAPMATEASEVSAESFRANWNAVPGATGYVIDVYTFTGDVATDLFISEYVEGSSNNKYIEIYNGTAAPVDLSDYALRLYPNGAVAPSPSILLEGTLGVGEVIVYKNSGATNYSGVAHSNGAVNYNGDDAVELFKLSTNQSVDIFGRIGQDPGTAWTMDGLTTLDKTLVRNGDVTSGVMVNPPLPPTPPEGFPTLATEWTQYDIDDVSHLGSHAFGEIQYILQDELVGDVTSIDVTGLESGTTYYYVVRAVNSQCESTPSNAIQVTTNAVCVPPSDLTYDENLAIYCQFVEIAPNTPTFDGDAATAYAISDELPAGLTFNTMTGVISGTPTATLSETVYTITVTNACGSTTADVSLGVQTSNTWYADNDNDGFGDATNFVIDCNVFPPIGYVDNDLDCDDNHIGYLDNDNDGYGIPVTVPCGGVENFYDCNDGDADIHPGAAEVCNGLDDNCDSHVDEGLLSTPATSITSTAGLTLAVNTPTNLTALGGNLGDGANWIWYLGGCGTGSPVGNGATLSGVTQSTPGSYVYYVRAEGCNTTTCTLITLTFQEEDPCGGDPPLLLCPNVQVVCQLADPFTLSGGWPIGGTYSGPGVVDGMFHPSMASVGTNTLTYTYTIPETECQGSCFFDIIVISEDSCMIGSMLNWVLLTPDDPGCDGGPEYQTDCSIGRMCYGLEYTPGFTGILTDYSSTFFSNCVPGGLPVYNSSCALIDQSDELFECPLDAIFILTSGIDDVVPYEVVKGVPVVIHKVCFDLDPENEPLILERSVFYAMDMGITLENTFVTDFPSYSATIIEIETPDVSLDSNSPVCEGEDIILTGGPVGDGYTYSWFGPDNEPVNPGPVVLSYTQDFNTFGTSTVDWENNVTLPGWYVLRGQGDATPPNTPVTILPANTGITTSGSAYNYGTTGSPDDRALGTAASNSIASGGAVAFYYGIKLSNTTGQAFTTADVAYRGEQYRVSGNTNPQSLTVEYSTDATALNNGNWTAIPELTFVSPTTTGDMVLDGNFYAQNLATTLSDLNILPGTDFWVRWSDLNDSGNDHQLAIDDVSISLTGPPSGTSGSEIIISNATSAQEGTYTLVVTDELGCSASSTVNVVVTNVANIDAGTYSGACTDGEHIVLDNASPAGGVWTGIGVYEESGIYYFDPSVGSQTLTYTIVGNCGGSDQVTIEVGEGLAFDLFADSPYCEGENVVISGGPVGADAYQWTGPNGPIDLPVGVTIQEDFNGLAPIGSSDLLPGGTVSNIAYQWKFLEAGTNANTTYAADNGNSTGGNTYSYGEIAIGERAFGSLLSGSLNSILGVQFTNHTGEPITRVTISYTGEQWRLGTADVNIDRLDFQYSTDATALDNGTWTDVNELDFETPNNTGVGAKNGNLPENQTVLGPVVISGLNVPDGGSLWLRWVDFNVSGSDDGLAIDDFSININGNVQHQLTISDVTAADAGTYTLSVTGNGCVTESSVMISVTEASFVDAGPDQGHCQNITQVQLNGSVSGAATQVLWTTSGTGTFDDPTSLTPVYTLGFFDNFLETIVLTLTTTDHTPGCSPATDVVLIALFTNTVKNTQDDAVDPVPGSLRFILGCTPEFGQVNFDLLPGDDTIILDGQEIVIDKHITINGPGMDDLRISGDNLSRIFRITNSRTLTIKGVTLGDGDTGLSDGSIIKTEAGATLNISDGNVRLEE